MSTCCRRRKILDREAQIPPPRWRYHLRLACGGWPNGMTNPIELDQDRLLNTNVTCYGGWFFHRPSGGISEFSGMSMLRHRHSRCSWDQSQAPRIECAEL